MAKWKVAGINFDHFHMGDLLREAFNHPDAEIVGICDAKPKRMQGAIANFGIPADRVYTDPEKCLAETKPDLVILCPATAEHATWVERVAPAGVNILMEKPFAASIADADRMIAAVAKTGKLLAINWPLAWYRSHNTTKRLIDEGVIGDVIEVHFYDGNRGPLYHLADKVEVTDEEVRKGKPNSWFYKTRGRRRQPARLCRLRRDARHLVHERRGADRSHLRHGRAARGWRSTSIPSPSAATSAACRNSRRAGAPSPIRGRCSRSRNAASSSSARTARSPATTTTTTSPCRRARSASSTRFRPTRSPRRAARRSNTCFT